MAPNVVKMVIPINIWMTSSSVGVWWWSHLIANFRVPLIQAVMQLSIGLPGVHRLETKSVSSAVIHVLFSPEVLSQFGISLGH